MSDSKIKMRGIEISLRLISLRKQMSTILRRETLYKWKGNICINQKFYLLAKIKKTIITLFVKQSLKDTQVHNFTFHLSHTSPLDFELLCWIGGKIGLRADVELLVLVLQRGNERRLRHLACRKKEFLILIEI